MDDTTHQKHTRTDLCGVCKISELCLPQDQAVGVLHAVAQLKAKHSVLRQGTVREKEGSCHVLSDEWFEGKHAVAQLKAKHTVLRQGTVSV